MLLSDIPKLYRVRYHKELDLAVYGFTSMEHLTSSMNSLIQKKRDGPNTMVRAKKEVQEQWKDEDKKGIAHQI